SKKINFINITPSLRYRGILYGSSIRKTVDENNRVITEEIPGLNYAHVVLPNISSTFNPKFYGFYSFRNPDSRLVAVRHVITPVATVSYTPDMSWFTNYYDSYTDTSNKEKEYSIYEGYVFGAPAANGKSATLSLNLRNNLEMKWRSFNDTAESIKKVGILDNFDFSTNYDIIEKIWTPLNLTSSTRLFNLMSVNFGATWDPYPLTEDNKRNQDILLWKEGNIGRLTNTSLVLSFSLRGGKKDKEVDDFIMDQQYEQFYLDYLGYDPDLYYSAYANFHIPWSMNVNYSYNYSKRTSAEPTINQSLRLSGDVSLTNKWKIGVNTGYDIMQKEFTTTSINIYRDLHCWEMSLRLVPFGPRQSYTFKINVKASILQDLKFDKKKSWYDRL
ncbi:MAG: putative LPS assembly protein LptD, partial [Bacteroidota bacterium]